MKKNIYFVISIVVFLFSGCLRSLEKEGINPETIYKGRVIDAKNNPLSGIMVRITNGSLIYNSVATGQDGIFQISVDISKIDRSYYIQVGEGDMIKRSSLKGFGLDVYDYGDIPFVDVKLPDVETMGLIDVKATSFTCKCNVKSQGAAIVTERGVCWSTNIPTIDDNREKFGSGEGIFSCTVSSESININTTTYYARAYAINEHGVGYGDAVEINSSKMEYFALPSFEYGGYIYHVHPDMGGMQWGQGNTACLELTAYGFDDWFLPNKEELLAIGEQTDVLNMEYEYWSCSQPGSYTNYHQTVYYYTDYYNPSYNGWRCSASTPSGTHWISSDKNIYRVIPVRKDR